MNMRICRLLVSGGFWCELWQFLEAGGKGCPLQNGNLWKLLICQHYLVLEVLLPVIMEKALKMIHLKDKSSSKMSIPLLDSTNIQIYFRRSSSVHGLQQLIFQCIISPPPKKEVLFSHKRLYICIFFPWHGYKWNHT